MTAAPERRRAFRLRVKAAVASLYFALMFFVAAPAAILHLTRDTPLATGGRLAVLAGIAIIALANAYVIQLVATFIRDGDGTHVPIDPPRRFVETRAYRHTRNPMYLAYIAVIVGEALLFRSTALLIYAAVLWAIAHFYVVLREEPLLERRFGDAYADYRRRVPRWFPGPLR